MRASLWLVLPLIAALTSPLAAAEEPVVNPLFPGDSRLAAKVTVRRQRIYLGELTETLSEVAKVRLEVETEKGPLDGVDLTVFVHERPLRELMAALVELLSHRRHTCE